MKLEELLRNLSFGELSNLSIGNEGAGYISDNNIPKMVMYTNQSLSALYTRFILSQRELVLRSYDHIVFYYLRPEFAESSDAPAHTKYIMDSKLEPYKGDIIRVLQVFNEIGKQLPLNDNEQFAAVFTPQYDCIQLTHPVSGDVFSVLYQANHPTLNDEDLSQEIRIPFFLEEALQAHVAYKVFSHMAGDDNSAKAMEHLQRFENICVEVVEKDLVHTSVSNTNIKAYKWGWQ